jgi:hypothetical protein
MIKRNGYWLLGQILSAMAGVALTVVHGGSIGASAMLGLMLLVDIREGLSATARSEWASLPERSAPDPERRESPRPTVRPPEARKSASSATDAATLQSLGDNELQSLLSAAIAESAARLHEDRQPFLVAHPEDSSLAFLVYRCMVEG